MNPTPLRRRAAVVAACVLAGAGATVVPATHAQASTPCDAMTTPVHEVVNPTTGSSLLTTWASEVTSAGTKHGFTDDLGTPFTAATAPSDGLVAVHRMYRASTTDFLWALEPDVDTWKQNGYTDEGVAFHALPSAASCAAPVVRYTKGASHHRFAVGNDQESALVADGWKRVGVAFYAPLDTTGKDPVQTPTDPGDGEQPFTIAVMPDTQQMTSAVSTDTRLKDETTWLTNNASDLNLKFVQQVGDLTNWSWLVPAQRTRAEDALTVFQNAHLPYQVAVGNHDTRVVGWNGVAGSTGYGGSGYQDNPECPTRLGADQCHSNLLVRHTEEYNSTFKSADMGDVVEQFEPGKIDNQYSEFTAGGHTWMVLQLELYPRTEAIDWAKNVVASHPHDNVMIVTHSYLDGSGNIASYKEYGSNSPATIWSSLASQYSNVKFVFSGHVGTGAYRTDTGVQGNEVASWLQNDAMSIDSNPVRLVTIDPANGTVTSRVHDIDANNDLTQFATTTTGMDFVS